MDYKEHLIRVATLEYHRNGAVSVSTLARMNFEGLDAVAIEKQIIEEHS